MSDPSLRRQHARDIWQAAVAAADPFALVRQALTEPTDDLRQALARGGRILVVGGGKAGSAMAAGAEAALADHLERVSGVVNVPAEQTVGTPVPPSRTLHRIRLHPGRPAGSNEPTPSGVAGVEAMFNLVGQALAGDVGLCLLSGGGSALLPAPVLGLTLEDKQRVTSLLLASGATIGEMNCVRKHLSRIKGGRLAQAFHDRGCPIFSLIVSDVIGDPLDVIASGPTAPDPTTFADALAVLERHGLRERVPASVRAYLERGRDGSAPETLKTLPEGVHNLVLGNNAHSLAAATQQAEALGYSVLNLGSFLEGETREVALVLAGIVRSIRADRVPVPVPVCVLSGGETTVSLRGAHGRGGRNQEFVLALIDKLGARGMEGLTALSGGTDGEDGPTDAAGAVADAGTWERVRRLGLNPADFLARHDAYSFFETTGDLLKTGLTGTNVMDVRVLLVVS